MQEVVMTWTRMILGGCGKWLDAGYILKGKPIGLMIAWNVGCERRDARMISRSWA